MREIFSQYFNRKTPDKSTLRKNYKSILYDKALSSIKHELTGVYIWAAFDETTDAQGRYIVCLVVGALYRDKPTTPYLLNAEILERRYNTYVSQFFTRSINIL